jgi:hypothetical protein
MAATELIWKMFHNSTRSLDNYLNVRQVLAVKKMIKGICKNWTTVLQKLREKETWITASKFRESLSFHLGNIDLSNLLHDMTKKAIKKTKSYRGYTILSGDASDIFKPHAQAMQGISCIRDWSTGLLWNWYILYWININGITHQIDVLDHTKEYIWTEKWEEMLIKSASIINPKQTIWIFDRWHDDIWFIDILHDLDYHYVVRWRKNRIVMLADTWKQAKVWWLWLWKRKVTLEYWTNCFLYIVKWIAKDPDILYSDIDFEIGEECLEIYLKRRQIELDYNKMKSFWLEHVRLMSVKKIQSIIHIIQYIIMFWQICFNEIQEGLKSIPYKLAVLYKQYCKKAKKTMNPTSLLTFVSIYISWFVVYNTSQITAITLFGNRRKMKKVGLI